MALTITEAGASSATANAAVYNSSSVGCADGDVLVVFVGASGTVQRPTTLTCSNQPGYGSTFTLVTSSPLNAIHSLYAFIQNGYCTRSTATASSFLTWDCTGDNATGAIIHVQRVAGMARTGPLSAIRRAQISSNMEASTRPSITMSSLTFVTSAVLGAVATLSSVTKLSPPGGWTEYSDTGYATPVFGLESCGNVGTASTLILWGSSTSSSSSIVVMELLADDPSLNDFMGAALEYRFLY